MNPQFWTPFLFWVYHRIRRNGWILEGNALPDIQVNTPIFWKIFVYSGMRKNVQTQKGIHSQHHRFREIRVSILWLIGVNSELPYWTLLFICTVDFYWNEAFSRHICFVPLVVVSNVLRTLIGNGFIQPSKINVEHLFTDQTIIIYLII